MRLTRRRPAQVCRRRLLRQHNRCKCTRSAINWRVLPFKISIGWFVGHRLVPNDPRLVENSVFSLIGRLPKSLLDRHLHTSPGRKGHGDVTGYEYFVEWPELPHLHRPVGTLAHFAIIRRAQACDHFLIHKNLPTSIGYRSRLELREPFTQHLGMLRQRNFRLLNLRVPFLFPLGADIAVVAFALQ